jgi:hypothetical protein
MIFVRLVGSEARPTRIPSDDLLEARWPWESLAFNPTRPMPR